MCKMIYLIIAIAVLIDNQTVNCSLISFLSEKFDEVKQFFIDTGENAYNKLLDFLVKLKEKKYVPEKPQSPPTRKIIIEKVTEPEIEKPEFVNLRLEPGMFLGTPQLAFWHGHNMESHMVRTEDGYSLCLHRLSNHPFPPPNKTVLLHHGLLGSSTDWILLGSKKSLPYYLSSLGYDVWIANARGNYFSRGHSSMTPGFAEFWNFSFHEMGIYDLPAVIKYIRKARNSDEPINYIGHSMGGTALLVLLSMYPNYEEYFRIGIFLAPLVYMNHVEGPMKSLSSVPQKTTALGDTEFAPSRKLPLSFATKFCSGPQTYCTNPLFFFSGIPMNHDWTPSFIARMMYHIPAGGSTKTILHYLQIIANKKFHKYDNPRDEYNLKEIKLPIALFSSSDDWLSTVPDVLKLFFTLKKPIDHYIIRGRNMTHTDFVFGPEANLIVFNKISDYLANGLKLNSVSENEVN